MKIEYGRVLTIDEQNLIRNISDSCGILYDTAKVLFYRGIKSEQKAKEYLFPNKDMFYSPLLFNDMDKAISKITLAKEQNKNVLVFGDYDADGICATTILYNCLKDFGIEARIFVPEREEGYGLNFDKIMDFNAQSKIDLLITVDCGISDYEIIERLNSEGIDVIVTDHHEPPEILPNCININPKLKGQNYPFNGLCGGGVAYKLGYALIGEKANKYLDFVALATVADSMDLVDENRVLVSEGLKLFTPSKIRPAFNYLSNGNNRAITSQTLAYQFAPRINAGGRMGDANSALKLFTSENENEIIRLAVKLNEFNIARQVECDKIYREAKSMIITNELYLDSVILVCDNQWKTGFVGIVAARLVEEYAKPVIVFAGADGHFKGSARSVDGINIYDAILSASDLLIGFGGHSQAAGVSVKKESYEPLRKALCQYVDNIGVSSLYEPTVFSYWQIDSTVSIRFAKELEMLEPFGVGNRKPVFSTIATSVKSEPLRMGSQHYQFNSPYIEILDFNGEGNVETLALPVKKHLLFELSYSNFKGNESVKGILKNVVCEYENFQAVRLEVFRNEILKIIRGKVDIDYVDEELEIKEGYGTIYALSDVKNMPQTNLAKYLFKCEEKGSRNCIVVSPKEINEGYKKLKYIDKPFAIHKCNISTEVYTKNCNLKERYNLTTDRGFFEKIYGMMTKMCGKKYTNSAEMYKGYEDEVDAYNFIFANEVFFELGLFYTTNGILKKNINLRNPLKNSKIYCTIDSLEV